MATILQVGTSAMGGYLAPAHLQAGFQSALMGMQRFRQFAEVITDFGPRSGNSVTMNRVSNFASAGGAVAETATMPLGTATLSQATLSISEYGQAVDYSLLLSLTAKGATPEQVANRVLANDASKALENAVETALDGTVVRYVATGTAAATVTTNGTATVSNTSALNLYHLRAIRDYLKGTRKCAKFDGQNYLGIVTYTAHANIESESTIESWRMYADPASLLAGEVGRVAGFRLIEDTECDGFDATIGSGSLTGEGYFFGLDAEGVGPLLEAAVQPLQIRTDESDYGRIKGIAWYYVGGWRANPAGVSIKWTSA